MSDDTTEVDMRRMTPWERHLEEVAAEQAAAEAADDARQIAYDGPDFVPRRWERSPEQRRLDAEAELDIVRLLAGGEPELVGEELARVDLAELVEAAEPGPAGAH